MQTPAVPISESTRLCALKSLDILDTEPDEHLDRITRICCTLFDVPIALVSLVDSNRQMSDVELADALKQDFDAVVRMLLLVIFVPLLAFAIWEYVKVSRDLERERRRDREP